MWQKVQNVQAANAHQRLAYPQLLFHTGNFAFKCTFGGVLHPSITCRMCLMGQLSGKPLAGSPASGD